jgi:hypothetical protein
VTPPMAENIWKASLAISRNGTLRTTSELLWNLLPLFQSASFPMLRLRIAPCKEHQPTVIVSVSSRWKSVIEVMDMWNDHDQCGQILREFMRMPLKIESGQQTEKGLHQSETSLLSQLQTAQSAVGSNQVTHHLLNVFDGFIRGWVYFLAISM